MSETLAASGREPTFEREHYRLAFHLGLLPLEGEPVCHGFRCGCVCTTCCEWAKHAADCRARGVDPYRVQEVRQPWETVAA